jgi:hypothetical protein
VRRAAPRRSGRHFGRGHMQGQWSVTWPISPSSSSGRAPVAPGGNLDHVDETTATGRAGARLSSRVQ